VTAAERVQVKRTHRVHPEWTAAQVWARLVETGALQDGRTVEDVAEVIKAMGAPRQEVML
jgi:hydroxymethylpyrimidine/phosphomethylpyrimidine kinase